MNSIGCNDFFSFHMSCVATYTHIDYFWTFFFFRNEIDFTFKNKMEFKLKPLQKIKWNMVEMFSIRAKI